MKEEYDFSKGERGKFFRNNIKLNLPVYLDDDVLEFVEKIAKRKNKDTKTSKTFDALDWPRQRTAACKH
jgi:hypothetical protein